MTNSANNTESNTESIPQTQTDTGYSDEAPKGEEGKPAEEDKSNLDEFGYEKTDEEKPKEDKPAEEVVKDEEEDKPIKDPVTGYGEDDTTEKPAEEVVKDEDKTPEILKKEEVDKAIADLPEGYDKVGMAKFALENKMSKEQIEAYVKFSQEENQQLKSDQDAQLKATRKQWKDELMNDSEFGGELFAKNIDRVEKLLEKHMPNMKKTLTDKGRMLPPYIMRDLLGMSKLLNPTVKLVNGGPSEPKPKEENFLDEMYDH